MKNDINLKRVCFLESERVFLTPTNNDDFEDHYRWNHDREMVYLDDMYFRPKNYSDAREAFEKRIQSKDVVALSIILKETGEHIGVTELYGIDEYERKCFWGVVLDRKFWRQGLGTEVAGLMIRYVFEDLGFRRLKSYTHSGNPGSMVFQEKLGFVKEAHLRQEYFFGGAFVDGIDYGMLKEDYERAFKQ
ncbi:MAG: GNAT family N-acetyltransferase [candidate division Zixibacteria bacterium]|nr:GNAT family N-acetyltransferase [candidate division Zixibacteria bacterium]